MQIGSKPGEKVFQAKEGGDTFLVLSLGDATLHLYQVADTLLRPSVDGFKEYEDKPYFWSETTGLMYVLSEVSFGSFAHIEDQDDAEIVLENLEGFLQSL